MPLNVRLIFFLFRAHRDAFVCPSPPYAAFKREEPTSVSQVARWNAALSSLQLYGDAVAHVRDAVEGGCWPSRIQESENFTTVRNKLSRILHL